MRVRIKNCKNMYDVIYGRPLNKFSVDFSFELTKLCLIIDAGKGLEQE